MLRLVIGDYRLLVFMQPFQVTDLLGFHNLPVEEKNSLRMMYINTPGSHTHIDVKMNTYMYI